MTRDSCFLFQRLPTVLYQDQNDSQRVSIRRRAAIGDVVAATCVADKLHERGYEVVFQCDPGIHPVLRRHPRIKEVARPDLPADVYLDGIYENSPDRQHRSFASFFIEAANTQLATRGIRLGKPLNCTPTLDIPDHIREAATNRFRVYPKPWVFVCPRSHFWLNRTVYDDTWSAAAAKIDGTKFWIGMHPAAKGFVDLHCRRVEDLMDWIPVADLMVTVDTGPMHLAAAFGVPIVAIEQASSPEVHLSDQNDFLTIRPAGLTCLNCQKNICPIHPQLCPCQNIDPEIISQAANAKLRGGVSACISVYKPQAEVLNRCIAHLTPQVDEIVIVRDQEGFFPVGVTHNSKTRYLVKQEKDIGYGRKMNFATRNSFGRFVLHCNDDLFLAPDAVEQMKRSMGDGIGIVSPLLRKPDGRIQHAGKLRRPNERGWYHVDYGSMTPSAQEPVEAENTCGACWLVDRQAHFRCGAYDERFYLYAEDDAYCLQMRRAGYRIIFNPHAWGTHLEHQSTNVTGDLGVHIRNSNALFGKLWGGYLEHNANRIPGDFAYL